MDAEPTNHMSDALRECELRYLRERDRALGLEQELSRATSGAAERELKLKISQMEHSASYKIGRLLTAPFGFAAKTLGAARRVLQRYSQTRRHSPLKGSE